MNACFRNVLLIHDVYVLHFKTSYHLWGCRYFLAVRNINISDLQSSAMCFLCCKIVGLPGSFKCMYKPSSDLSRLHIITDEVCQLLNCYHSEPVAIELPCATGRGIIRLPV